MTTYAALIESIGDVAALRASLVSYSDKNTAGTASAAEFVREQSRCSHGKNRLECSYVACAGHTPASKAELTEFPAAKRAFRKVPRR